MVSQLLEHFNHIGIIAISASQLFWNANPKGSFCGDTLNQLITLINVFGAVAVTNKLQEFLSVDELFVAGAFTNFLGLTKVNSCFQIEDMLKDFQKRVA